MLMPLLYQRQWKIDEKCNKNDVNISMLTKGLTQIFLQKFGAMNDVSTNVLTKRLTQIFLQRFGALLMFKFCWFWQK